MMSFLRVLLTARLTNLLILAVLAWWAWDVFFRPSDLTPTEAERAEEASEAILISALPKGGPQDGSVKRSILVVDAPWDSPNGDLRGALISAIDADPRCARIEPSVADRARAEIPGALSDAFSELWRNTVAGTAPPDDSQKVTAALGRWMNATGADAAVALGYAAPPRAEITSGPPPPVSAEEPDRPLVGYVLERGESEVRRVDLVAPTQPTGFQELTAAQAERSGFWGQAALWLGFTLFFPIAFRGPINRVLERESNRANFGLLLALGVANLGFALVLSGLSVTFSVVWLLIGSIVLATIWHLTICTTFDKIRD